MPNQPTLADPIPVWAPATYSSPVNNPSAPRVGWFVVDGTCHGEPAHGGHTNALGSNLYASDDGTAKCLQSESEEDAVTSELPVGSPASAAIDGASPTLATLRDNTNVTAVAPASATEPQVSSFDKDAGHRTDSGRAAASEQGGDENAPTMGTSGLMSVAGVLALWARSRNTSEELWSEDENEEYETDSEDDEHGDEDGEEDDEEGDDDEDDEDTDQQDEVEDDDEDVPFRVRVTSPLYRYLGYESRYH